ncbi:MAG: HD domain-containing phosphohydrolase [Chloroherpetonaceae bacterium]|nr:HD domain-containing protein [Chthonomonadaceae bacterium]MDW8207886.1 HD domain-containing phosphohydrolase [Chloroherpetonaceae bacterium]
MQMVAASAVREGMYVAADVRDDQGRTLIARGQRIGQHHIVRLRKFRIEAIFIDPDHGVQADQPARSTIRERCERVLEQCITGTMQEFSQKRLVIDAAAVREAVDCLVAALVRSRNALITLSDVAAGTDRFLQHAVNTAVLATILGVDLRVPEAMLKDLAAGMLFHDIGKLFLPEQVTALQGLPSAEDVAVLQQHPQVGCEHLLRSGAVSSAAAAIVLRHHELLDGSGFPHGVSGDRLSTLMQIASVAEVYDTLTSSQFGLPPAMPDVAVSYLIANAGTLFAREVVAALCRRVALYPKGCAVLLNSGEIGVVAGTLPNAPTRPVVLVHFDRSLNRLQEPMIVDLAQDAGRCVNRSASTMEELMRLRDHPATVPPINPLLAHLG